MMRAGYIYCMSSPSHYDKERQQYLYKIGRTERLLKRLHDMNRKSTHVPAPFVLHFAKKVNCVHLVEKKLHRIFAMYRYHPHREYFAVSLEDIKEQFECIRGKWVDMNDLFTQGESKRDVIVHPIRITHRYMLRNRSNY